MTTPKENSGSLSEYQRISGNLDAIEESLSRQAKTVGAIFDFCTGIEMICRGIAQIADAFQEAHDEINGAARYVREEALRVHLAKHAGDDEEPCDTDPDGGVI